MNLILLRKKDFIGPNQVELVESSSDGRFRHIRRVLKAKEGDSLSCGMVNGNMGQGRIVSLTDSSVIMELAFSLLPPEPPGITLVLALPRPKMLKRIVQMVTSLGIKEIHLVNSWRVEKSFWDSPFLEPGALVPYMEAGLEQAKDTIMPRIFQHRFFSSFVHEKLPGICVGKKGLVAHPRALEPCPFHVKTPVVVAVGPEGGFIDDEIAAFQGQGMTCVSIGQRILRVETAVPFLIGRLDGFSS